MWSLFNMNDSKSLTLYDLEKGVNTVTQSEEFFDCLPAVSAAFSYAKVFSNKGVDEEEEAEKKAKEEAEKKAKEQEKNKKKDEIEVIKAPTRKVEKTLEYEEFRMFLQTLRQYYIYCQVGGLRRLVSFLSFYTLCLRSFIMMTSIQRKLSRKRNSSKEKILKKFKNGLEQILTWKLSLMLSMKTMMERSFLKIWPSGL